MGKSEPTQNRLINEVAILEGTPIRTIIELKSKSLIRGHLAVDPEILVPFIQLINPSIISLKDGFPIYLPEDFEEGILSNFTIIRRK